MGKLYRTPEGFLDLTGQRVGGRYPQEVSDVVAPTLDLFPILGSRLLSSEVAPLLTSAYLDSVSIPVPDNETWLLIQAGCQATPATNSLRLSFRIYLDNLPGSSDPINQIPLQYDRDIGIGGGNNPRTIGVVSHFPNGIALPAGAVINGQVIDENATNIPWSLQVGFYRLTGN